MINWQNQVGDTSFMNRPGGFLGLNNNIRQQIFAQPQAPAPVMPPYQQLDPFLSASAGGVQGGFQPYINKLANQATQALNGGLLEPSPQALQPGNAGGTPEKIADPRMQGLLAQGFAPREWNR